MPDIQHAYQSMRLAKNVITIPITGATIEGTIDKLPALSGAGDGEAACALAIATKLDATAKMTTTDLKTLVEAIVWTGDKKLLNCKQTSQISHNISLHSRTEETKHYQLWNQRQTKHA